MDSEQDNSDLLQQLDNLLSSNSQSWLFGAGSSVDSGVPLMGVLTKRVIAKATTGSNKSDSIALEAICKELDDNCHIEHILSHIADRRAITERCRDKTITFGEAEFTLETLEQFHRRLLTSIAETVRWGYMESTKASSERIGTSTEPIVTIDNQIQFIRAVFGDRQKNVSERRRAVKIFTTNYDTLLEDALALECIPYWDGFEGGAVGFRSFRFGDNEPISGVRAHVVKLHGSIDWHLGNDGRIWRVRDKDSYPEKTTRVLIYPQATKYVATQRDPFASQFDLLRKTLSSREENLFAICGYSFGDEHINLEIQLAMGQSSSKTTILAFACQMNHILQDWSQREWNKRLYVITEEGVFVGGQGPFLKQQGKKKLDWWMLQGVTRLLMNGPEACVK